MIGILALVLVISTGSLVPKAAVLIVGGTVPGERTAADSCVRNEVAK